MKKLKSLEDLALVYSSETGSNCAECGKALNKCACGAKEKVWGDGRVRVQLQTKGRKGKGVSVVSGLACTEKELKLLAKELKSQCGVGGAVKEGNIEIQGNKVSKILEILAQKGIQAKKSGG